MWLQTFNTSLRIALQEIRVLLFQDQVQLHRVCLEEAGSSLSGSATWGLGSAGPRSTSSSVSVGSGSSTLSKRRL